MFPSFQRKWSAKCSWETVGSFTVNSWCLSPLRTNRFPKRETYSSFSHCSVFINALRWWEMTVELLQRRRKEWRKTRFTLQKHSVLFHLRAWPGLPVPKLETQHEILKKRWYNSLKSQGGQERKRRKTLRHQVKSIETFRREVSVCLVSWLNASLVSMRSTEVAACTDTMVTAGILGRSNMSLASGTHINTPGSNRGGL